MVSGDKAAWKAKYFAKLHALLQEFPKVLMVTCNNVGSKQMQQIRMKLRGQAEILFGKNTMMRKAISMYMEDGHPEVAALLPHIQGNVGFVFTHMDLSECRDTLLENRVSAPAKAGAFAPIDVTIEAGNTGMGPEKTSFFQALAIPTKIARGTIEILNPVPLIKTGDRVGASEAMLLNMMGVSPFTYGLVLTQVYDNGSAFDPEILDITNETIIGKFMAGVANVAAVSLAIGYPTAASVPHSVANAFKNVLAVAVATEIEFPQADKIKAYLKDPSAFAVAAPAASAAAPAAAAAEAKAPEPEEEEEEDEMDFDLFD